MEIAKNKGKDLVQQSAVSKFHLLSETEKEGYRLTRTHTHVLAGNCVWCVCVCVCVSLSLSLSSECDFFFFFF